MSSWYSSWLPGLPTLNFAIPSNLQGRFVSFLLKKCLGHFLKPGQLDARQIESQMGSGFVQVNDLELDNEAINSFLTGLPLVLSDGYISAITARVPWSNLLTSNLGLSLDSLHLTFRVIPVPSTPQGVDLAESVASVADSFVHEELTEQENTALWASAHQEIVDEPDGAIPGALDPFVPDRHEELPKTEHEAVGVSLFSTLIERLLARFEFTAVNTKFTFIHEGNMSLTISIPEIHYGAEGKSDTGGSSSSSMRGILTVDSITVTTQDLRSTTKVATSHHTTPPSIPPSPACSLRDSQIELQPASPATSSSSLDEETEALMSQSLVALPPRSSSPADSLANSLYQSALDSSGQAKEPVVIDDKLPSEDVSENILLSFGTAPFVLRIETPSPLQSDTDEPPPSQPSFKVTVTAGVIASALHAWQLAGMVEILEFFVAHGKGTTPARPTGDLKTASVNSSRPTWTIDVGLKELVVLVLPTNLAPGTGPGLDTFFADPSSPPHLFGGYLRLNARNIVVKASSVDASSNASDDGKRSSFSAKRDLVSELTCVDVNASIYSFQSPTEDMAISPILRVDHHLKDQYTIPNRRHILDAPLPTFIVNEWESAKLHDFGTASSSGQAVPHGENTHRGSLKQSEGQSCQDEPPPAIHVHVECFSNLDRGTHTQSSQNEISVSVLPICILLDMKQVIGNANVTAFLNEFARKGSVEQKISPTGVEEDDMVASDSEHSDATPPASAKLQTYTERETERKRLERLVMEDLGLSVKFPTHEPELAQIRTPRTKRRVKSQTQTNVSLSFSMIRVCLRCSPLPGLLPRSGVLSADFHHLSLSTAERPANRHPRFTLPVLQADYNLSQNDPYLRLECDAIVFALSPVGEALATTMVLLTSLDDFIDSEATDNTNTTRAPLVPRISVSNGVDPDSTVISTALDVNVPSVHLNLTKQTLDGLLFLADDATRLLELETAPGPSSEHQEKTHNSAESANNRLHISASITEVTTRLMVPRSDADRLEDRPFDISASDVVVSFDVPSENTAVARVEAMELSIKNMSPSREVQTILVRSATRQMSSLPKSTLKFSFTSSLEPKSGSKVSTLTSALWGLTGTIFPDTRWLKDLKKFFQSPPGVFESVIPNERTTISLKAEECAARMFSPTYPGGLVLHLGDLEFMTEIVGNATENTFRLLVPNLSLLGSDDMSACEETGTLRNNSGVFYWKSCGYALIAEVTETMFGFSNSLGDIPDTRMEFEKINLRIHLCADTMTAISRIIADWQKHLGAAVTEQVAMPRIEPAMVSEHLPAGLTTSVDELAFRRLPEIGPAPDMIADDLPTNLDYLDESFSATAGLREFSDEDLDDFRDENDFDVDLGSSNAEHQATTGITSRVGGETIKMMRPEGVQVIEGYFESLPGDASTASSSIGGTSLQILIHDCNFTLCLYDGYDWTQTRKTIEEEVKDIRRRLARLKQLVASGQTPDASMEEMSSVLFNSVYIGLDQDVESLEPGALLAAIDEHLNDDMETASQSSWQSLRPHSSGKAKSKSVRVHGKRLNRSKNPSMEFVLTGAKAEMEHYRPSDTVLSRTFVTVKDVEIFDHIKTSTWRKFLTALQLDTRGNTRETDSNMVRVELQNVRPVPGHPSEEARLRAKILPLRLYVDQDAVDFLKKFFSFKDPNADPDPGTSTSQEAFIQFGEVFPVFLKLDYKPRRVDYKALREGRTIELMNFFHFDGAEMTLRHITLTGITGWARFFELLNDLWTPDVKATQLVDVISGVAPIRSVVNVGSGVADLVLLPIAQYKKDGRVLRGLQKGTTAFFKSTALEAIKLGARLATGTQVILEQAEGVLGGQFHQPFTTETISEDSTLMTGDAIDEERAADLISRYADQPMDITEGVHSAYKSLRKNFNSAAQTILAVPMEVYERSGDEGAIRSVIRAVPIAVLKPMIGATEAVSKTLLGLHNTLDSNVRHDNEAKYKHR
ncbi:hypothetical protein JOM56_003479 [Amanita muscaria]